ncbi:hypothetical protein BJX70DRAFT_310797 [Aspergillus crustosus]
MPSSTTDLPLSLFPDGLKTSGAHKPDYTRIRPFSDLPAQITGPTVWQASEYIDSPERWTHSFTDSEVAEISTASDDFIESGTPLTGITRALFPLPVLQERMDALRRDLLDGKGFFRFRNLPVRKWGLLKSAVAYMGLGTYLGYFVSQNGRGHVLGHVKDLGEDPTQTHRVRIYRTNARQFFHTDAGDMVGLLCIAKSLSGGESDIVSTHHVYNVLQREHPEVIQTFAEPNWYFDRKGEVSEGQEPWYKGAVMYLETDPKNPRVYTKLDPNNVTSLSRYNTGPDAQIPPLSEKQKYALEVLERTCKEHSLHMILEPGDIQFLHNPHVFHARTSYTDYPAGSVDEDGNPRPQRHLMRLWLGVPESEGGWKIPFADTDNKKRGGVQVNGQPPKCPIDAE